MHHYGYAEKELVATTTCAPAAQGENPEDIRARYELASYRNADQQSAALRD